MATSSSSSSADINRLINLLSHFDKDERYMATSDISSLIQSDTRIDENTERRICVAILKQLHDTNNDVQSVAVKCLSALIQKVNIEQVLDILKKLTTLIIDGKDDLRDIYSIGLKTCLTGIRTEMVTLVAPVLVSNLLQGIISHEGPVKLECLDILSEVLKKFGEFAPNDHSSISSVCIQVLTNKESMPVARKRAIACIGSLSAVASDALVNKSVEVLLGHVEEFHKQKRMNEQRYLIQAISAISRTTGQRLGSQVDNLVPLFLGSLKSSNDESMHNETSDELRENLLQGLESFVARCPRDVIHHIPTILTSVMDFIQYDPNYDYADDEDDNNSDEENENQQNKSKMDDDDDENYGNNDDDYGYGNDGERFDEEDDDTSWKVRRSSIRVLKAMILSNMDNLHEYFTKSMELLINRLKEREESVRLEIIGCLKTLISSSISTNKTVPLFSESSLGIVASSSYSSYSSTESKNSTSTIQPKNLESVSNLLSLKSSKLIRKVKKVLSEKNTSLKIRTALLNLLHELVIVLHGGLNQNQILTLMPHICSALNDRNSGLKLEGLELLHSILLNHSAEIIQQHIPTFFKDLVECVHSDWYKTVSEALRVISDLVQIMRSYSSNNIENNINFTGYLNPLFDAILFRLQATDIDQDIKENAILAISSLVSKFGSYLDKLNQVDPVLNLLLERLGNEVTRSSSLRAITEISKSSESIDLSSIQSQAYNDLTNLLRQQSRIIKQGALISLEAFFIATANSSVSSVSSNEMEIDESVDKLNPIPSIIIEASKLIIDSDLQLSHLALSLIITVIENQKSLSVESLSALNDETLPRLLDLSSSPLLSGLALDYLLKLLQLLSSKRPSEDFSPNILFGSFLSVVTGEQIVSHGESGSPTKKQALIPNISKQSAVSVAQCIASISCVNPVEGAPPHLMEIIDKLVNILTTESKSPNTRLVSALSLGYIGQNIDLSNTNPPVHESLLQIFDETAASEDLKVAAATALGTLSMGNGTFYIPVVMNALKDGIEQRQYLLLSTLKEIISHSTSIKSSMDISKDNHLIVLNVDEILFVLSRHREAEAEGIRNMVAECLGKLATIFPEQVISYVTSEFTLESSPKIAWTSATAIRYMVSSHNAPISYLNEMVMKNFTKLITHSDLNVRHATMVSLNSVLHHHSSLVDSFFLQDISSLLFEETVIKAELQHKIDLGPFKLTVDDGLPLRKAAYSVFTTALTTIPNSIPINNLINPYLINGLQDDVPEVQILCLQVVSEIANHTHPILSSNLDAILVALFEVLKEKQSSNSSASSNSSNSDRSIDLLRSGLRTLESICGVPGSSQNKKLHDFVSAQLKKESVLSIIRAEFSRTSSLFTFRSST